MALSRPHLNIGGALLLAILGSGCGDSSSPKPASANRQAAGDAKSPAPAEIDHNQSSEGTGNGKGKNVGADQPTVYPALELAKIMDFTKLSAPKGATREGSSRSSRLELKLPSKVPEAAAFYIEQLSKLGWTVDEKPGKKTINDSEAVVFFVKNGHIVSLMIFPTDEKKPECMVSLSFHGNLDAQSLPRSEGAKVLYGSPTQTIYTTTNKVPAEAEWVEKSLTAQGWQRYIRAKASEDKSDEQKIFDMRKQGYALSVFISAAPAQGNQTSVQYGLHAIAHELPAPPNATDLEFDDDAWTMHCEMPGAMDAGVAFYKQAMPAAGYKALPGEQPQEKYVNLRFGTEAGDVVLVQVAKKDDKTCKISITGVSAAMMEKLRKEEEKRTKPGR